MIILLLGRLEPLYVAPFGANPPIEARAQP